MGKYKFSSRSLKCLEQVHPLLANGCHTAIAISTVDFGIICGHRTREEQDDAYARGLSKLQFPASKHNQLPSLAVDFIPWPVDWKDSLAFARIAGLIAAGVEIAKIENPYKEDWQKLTTRWGGDWDRDGSTRDQSFMDLGHIELVTIDG